MADALGRLDEIRGRAGDVTVILHGLTVRDTPEGRRFPYGDFTAQFLQALHERLTKPRGGGVFRPGISCRSCRTKLDERWTRPVGVATEVALGRIPPIQVDLAMPGIVCPSCGTQMVRMHDRNVESDLSDALIAAFDSVALRY